MEKVILFIMIVGVGLVSGILLLSRTTQNQNPAITLGNSPTASQNTQPTTQQQQARPTETPIGPQEVLAPKEATIQTSKGDITVELFATEAAKTINNFAHKAKSNYYNGLIFHRVEDWVVQGGDPKGDGTGGGDMPMEDNAEPFVVGSLGVAGHQDAQGNIIGNDSQFFITKQDASWLNNQYTNFGKVISGMSVVNSLKIGDKILGITLQN